MSLLLDALKKAADENKKDSTSDEIEKNKEISSDQMQEEDLDLELELSGQEEVPEFPQVNQEIVRQVEESSEMAGERAETFQKTVSENISGSEPDFENELAEENINITQDVTVKEEFNPAKDDATGNEQEQVVELKQSNADNEVSDRLQRENVAEIERKHIQQMEALSALINKNNTFRSKRRRVRVLSVISFILFLLIAASFYAYMILENVDSEHINIGLTENVLSSNSETVEVKLEAPRKNVVNSENKVVNSSKNNHSMIGNEAIVTEFNSIKQEAKKPIRIRKKTLDDPIGVLLDRAYASFLKSDYQTAETVYNKVINRDKNNHDALLGLAAIALKKNRNDVAKRIYSKLLILDPKDSYAKAGMTALVNQKKSHLNESQLKIMLREQPNAGHLYFALGNIQLNQNRFAEAQTSFFSAWSTDKSNTDYAFNLAVSLDHLGKAKNALVFYELTIELFKKSGGNVSVDEINQRIKLIKGNSNG